MNEQVTAPFKAPGTRESATTIAQSSTALVPFTLDSEIAMTLQRLGVTLSSHNLSISKRLTTQDLLGLAQVLATVQERVEEIPQWLWGSFWNYEGFVHGDRKKLTDDPEWAGPSYNEWANQGAAYQLFLEWSSSQDIHTQNYARALFLPRSYFMKALLAPPENQKNLLDRCLSGEITSVHKLEDEIRGIKGSIPVPVPDSKSKAKRVTTTDVEAQVQSDEETRSKLPTSGPGYGRNKQQQPIDRERIRQCASLEVRAALDKPGNQWFQTIDECRLCAEISIDCWVGRMAELVIFKKMAPAQARAQVEKEYALSSPLRIKLRAAINKVIESWPKGDTWIGDNKHPIWDMITTCNSQELFTLAGVAANKVEETSDQSFQALAHEVITRYESGAKTIAEVIGLRAESIPSRQDQEQSARSEPERSPSELQAIERILKLCAGNNTDTDVLANWRRALAKVPTNDLLDWNRESGDNVLKVAGLITGDWEKGVAKALRIVRRVIDDRTSLSFLKNNCNAEGGHWEHNDGTFLFAVTRADRDVLNQTLCLTVKDSAKYEQIKEALEDNALDLSLADLAGLSSLNKELLERILIHLLYGSQQQPREVEISFEDSAP